MRFNYQFHSVTGGLTDDVKTTEKYANFSVAVNTGYGEKATVHFFNMTAFPNTFSEKMWNMLSNLKKGSNVTVEYDEQDGSYENKEGVKVKAVKRIVKAFKVYFDDKPKTEEGEAQAATSTTKPVVKAKTVAKMTPVVEDEGTDSIPF